MAEIMKRNGAERVSEKAASAMAEVLMDVANDIAKDAIRFAAHAGRKTIKRRKYSNKE